MDESYDYRDRSHRWLIDIVSGDKPSSPRHVAALYELERRKGRTARVTSWISLGIAFLSLAFSLGGDLLPATTYARPGRYYFLVHEDGFFRGDTATGEGVIFGVSDGKPKTIRIPFN